MNQPQPEQTQAQEQTGTPEEKPGFFDALKSRLSPQPEKPAFSFDDDDDDFDWEDDPAPAAPRETYPPAPQSDQWGDAQSDPAMERMRLENEQMRRRLETMDRREKSGRLTERYRERYANRPEMLQVLEKLQGQSPRALKRNLKIAEQMSDYWAGYTLEQVKAAHQASESQVASAAQQIQAEVAQAWGTPHQQQGMTPQSTLSAEEIVARIQRGEAIEGLRTNLSDSVRRAHGL